MKIMWFILIAIVQFWKQNSADMPLMAPYGFRFHYTNLWVSIMSSLSLSRWFKNTPRSPCLIPTAVTTHLPHIILITNYKFPSTRISSILHISKLCWFFFSLSSMIQAHMYTVIFEKVNMVNIRHQNTVTSVVVLLLFFFKHINSNIFLSFHSVFPSEYCKLLLQPASFEKCKAPSEAFCTAEQQFKLSVSGHRRQYLAVFCCILPQETRSYTIHSDLHNCLLLMLHINMILI